MSGVEILKLLWDFLVLITIGVGNLTEIGSNLVRLGAGPPCSSTTAPAVQKVLGPLQLYVDELPQMPKLNGYKFDRGFYKPTHLRIGMFQKKWKFHRDLPETTVFAFGTSAEDATVPGPTIEAIQGVPTYVTWENYLPDKHILPWDPTIPIAMPKYGGVPTVVHLHGGIQAPNSDGHADAWFTSSYKDRGPAWTRKTYTYPNIHHAGNLWYHDHAVGLTRINLLAGLSGAYLIRDLALEANLGLPSGPEFDRHLMIVDRSFNTDGSIYMNCTGKNPNIHPHWRAEYYGDAITVNGKAWPYLKVQRRKYRFRILNASNARYLKLTLSDGMEFVVVASDASYLRSPVTTSTVLLSPSEIADVIIDFTTTTATECLMDNTAPYPFPNGRAPNLYNGRVMKFVIRPDSHNFPKTSTSIPSALKLYSEATSVGAALTRYITLYEYKSAINLTTHLLINGKGLEDPVTETPKSGSMEVWEVINLTPDNHPLHLHLAFIQAIKVQCLVDVQTFRACMLAKNEATDCNVAEHAVGRVIDVPEYEKTWKNTVKVAPGCKTTVVVKFNLVDRNDAPYPFDATAFPGYFYHCHILGHEDNVMIRPLKLVP